MFLQKFLIVARLIFFMTAGFLVDRFDHINFRFISIQYIFSPFLIPFGFQFSTFFVILDGFLFSDLVLYFHFHVLVLTFLYFICSMVLSHRI